MIYLPKYIDFSDYLNDNFITTKKEAKSEGRVDWCVASQLGVWVKYWSVVFIEQKGFHIRCCTFKLSHIYVCVEYLYVVVIELSLHTIPARKFKILIPLELYWSHNALQHKLSITSSWINVNFVKFQLLEKNPVLSVQGGPESLYFD